MSECVFFKYKVDTIYHQNQYHSFPTKKNGHWHDLVMLRCLSFAITPAPIQNRSQIKICVPTPLSIQKIVSNATSLEEPTWKNAYLLERMQKVCRFRLQNLKFGNFLDLGLLGNGLLQDHAELRAGNAGADLSHRRCGKGKGIGGGDCHRSKSDGCELHNVCL